MKRVEKVRGSVDLVKMFLLRVRQKKKDGIHLSCVSNKSRSMVLKMLY